MAHLLQDELLVLRGPVLAEVHDENVCSCLHGDAGLWLVGVVANLILGRVLEKLKNRAAGRRQLPSATERGIAG